MRSAAAVVAVALVSGLTASTAGCTHRTHWSFTPRAPGDLAAPTFFFHVQRNSDVTETGPLRTYALDADWEALPATPLPVGQLQLASLEPLPRLTPVAGPPPGSTQHGAKILFFERGYFDFKPPGSKDSRVDSHRGYAFVLVEHDLFGWGPRKQQWIRLAVLTR